MKLSPLMMFRNCIEKKALYSRYEDIQHRREADREKIAQWTNAIADAQNELEMLRAR